MVKDQVCPDLLRSIGQDNFCKVISPMMLWCNPEKPVNLIMMFTIFTVMLCSQSTMVIEKMKRPKHILVLIIFVFHVCIFISLKTAHLHWFMSFINAR